jgi:hypothetical protein
MLFDEIALSDVLLVVALVVVRVRLGNCETGKGEMDSPFELHV